MNQWATSVKILGQSLGEKKNDPKASALEELLGHQGNARVCQFTSPALSETRNQRSMIVQRGDRDETQVIGVQQSFGMTTRMDRLLSFKLLMETSAHARNQISVKTNKTK